MLSAFLVSTVLAAAPIEPPPAKKVEQAPLVAGASRSVLRTHNDEFPVEIEKSLEAFIDTNKGLIGSVKPRPVKFPEALARARALIGSPKVANDAVRRAASLPAAKKPGTLKAATITHVLQRRHREAIALLLVAHERAPADPNPLFQLAGLLASLGEVNEALALLDEIQARGKAPQVQWGMDATNVVEYLRAYCLMRLGRKAEAKSTLRRVVAKEPHLTEAAHTLALIEVADGENPRKTFMMGLWRKRAKPFVTEPTERTGGDADKEGDSVAQPLQELHDFRRGTPGVLPEIAYPTTVNLAAAAHENLTRLERQLQGEFHALQDRLTQAKQKVKSYRHTDVDVSETREYALHTALTTRYGHNPELYRLWRKVEDERPALQAETTKIGDRFRRDVSALPPSNSYAVKCSGVRPIAERAMTTYRPHGLAADRRIRELYREWHLTATTIAANIGDPGWHEVLRLEIEVEKRRAYLDLVRLATGMTHYAESPKLLCQLAEQERAPAELKATSLKPCSDEQARNSVGWTLGTAGLPGAQRVVGVEVNCKGVSAELNLQLIGDLLSVSGEVGIDMSGEVTVFIGPKTAAAVPGAGTGHSFKDGMYVKVGKDGIHDIGAKVEIKATQGAFGVTASHTVESMEFSILPAPAAPPVPGVLPAFTGGNP